jgi:hypothetical protein
VRLPLCGVEGEHTYIYIIKLKNLRGAEGKIKKERER